VHSVDHAGLEVEEHLAWYVLSARGPVVKQVNAAELRVVVAAVLAVATDAVLVAQNLLKIGAHLVTALARLHVVVWHGKQKIPVVRARVSRTGK